MGQLTGEIERLNGILKQKIDEIEGIKRLQNDMEFKFNQEWESKISTYESRMRQTSIDKEGL